MKDTFFLNFKYFFTLVLFATLVPFLSSETFQEKIDFLNAKLRSRLRREDVPFKFMQTWAAKKGLYESSVHVNFLDKKNTWLTDKLRNSPIGDINMFVTSFVLYSQIEAQQLGTVKINDHDFSFALQSLSEFRDKNTEYGIPQYIFWPQELINGTWSAQPVNLINLARIWPNKVPRIVDKFLEYSGLWMIEYVKDLVFSIPADNDDSGVNLALLGLMKETNSSHFDWWNNYNFNKLAYYKKVLKYAYRPFDSNYSLNKFANQIDTRTYFVIRQFIESKNRTSIQTNSTPSLILPTTWLLKEDEQITPQIQIPLMSNNVDATVCCNVLFGLFYQVLTGIFRIQDLPELNSLIRDTVDFLVFSVENKIEVRPDIILVYYPSKYDFYWFLSRIVQLLKRYDSQITAQKIESLIYAKSRLEPLMKGHGTSQIVKNRKIQGNGNQTYWVEFMGNYAGKQRNDDAIFNTVMALNALYDTWTIRNKSQLTFDNQTPQEVKNILESGVNYLVQRVGKKMKEYNSFFSGSSKTFTTSNFNYPANVHEYKGKDIDPQTTKQADINYAMRFLVKGTIETEDYEQLCKLKWFERPVPQKFEGYNQMPFPFWSSAAITQVMLISVLSKKIKAK